ncbi:MAG: hypothetical protein EpisKO_04470 [Epibacterium sp.]
MRKAKEAAKAAARREGRFWIGAAICAALWIIYLTLEGSNVL